MKKTVCTTERTKIMNESTSSETSQPKRFVNQKPMVQGLVRSLFKVERNGQTHLINTGLTDEQGARHIASILFKYYDKDQQGSIDPVKTLPMLLNAYRTMNSKFNPQKEDVNSLFSILDVDSNSKITLEDLQNLCIRYLTGTPLPFPYPLNETSKY